MNSPEHDLIRSARLQAETASSVVAASHAPGRSSVMTFLTMWDIPGYSILHEIHRGGQGIVFQARQESTGRLVALKLLLEDVLASAQERLRFEREAHILSQVDHPGVVRIIDRGCVGNRQWIAMDLVKGRTLSWYYLDEQELDDHSAGKRSDQVHQRLRLFAAICDAVHAAHLHGVIHRDLKPGNVLVDDTGQPRVLDFGLAKMTLPSSSQRAPAFHDEGIHTITGLFVGSLPWASPEQVANRDASIDLRSDVYSLGVMLYQMLTGEFPYGVAGSLREVTENIANVPAQKPSMVNRHLTADLDTMVLRSLAKRPDRRYQSAGDLAQDLRQYLAGEPIEARRDSAMYLLRRVIGRYRAQLAVVAALILVIIGFAVTAWILYGREQIASANARAVATQATERLYETLILQARASRQSGLADRRQTSLEALARAAKIHPSLEVRNEAIAALAILGLKVLPSRMAGQVVATVDQDYQCCATIVNANSFQIQRINDGKLMAAIPAPSDGSNDVDSLHRLQLTRHYFARAYDMRDGRRRLEVWRIPESDLWISVDDLPDRSSFNISADEKSIAVPYSDKTIRVLDLQSRQEIRRIELESNAGYLKFDPSGRWLARFHGSDKLTVIHDLQTGEAQQILEGADTQWSLEWSSDGSLIAAAEKHLVRLWNPVERRIVGELRGDTDKIVFLRFSPDASRLASYSWDGQSVLWSVERREPLVRLPVVILAWPSANRLAGTTNDSFREFELEENQEFRSILGATDAEDSIAISRVAFDPLGRFFLIAANRTISLRAFEYPSGAEIAAIAAGPLTDAAIDRAGHTLVTIGVNGVEKRSLNVNGGILEFGPPQRCEHSPLGMNIDVSPDRRFAAAMMDSSGDMLGIVDVDACKLVRTVAVGRNGVAPKFSPDGRWIAVGNWNGDGNAVIIDTSSWECVKTLETYFSTIVQFSPDSRLIVSADSAEIAVWQTSDWTKIASTPAPLQQNMAFSPNGLMLAVIPIGNSLRLLETRTLQTLAVLQSPDNSQPRSAAFSPDGSTLIISAANSRLMQAWNLPLIRNQLAKMNLNWHEPAAAFNAALP